MTQEDKDLLIKDLCTRLPYGVKCKSKYFVSDTLSGIILDEDETIFNFSVNNAGFITQLYISEIKPYLFPLSSMTEEQEVEFLNTCVSQNPLCWTLDTFKWLIKNHFDYNYLIDDDLALDATNLGIYD